MIFLKNKKVLVVGVVLLVAAGALVFKGTFDRFMANHAGMTGEMYICPMHPTYSSDKPGQCPICGMTLVKVKKEKMSASREEMAGMSSGDLEVHKTVSGYTTVKLSPEKVHLIGIRLAEVKRRPATKVIRTVGRIAYDPELYQAEEEYLQSVDAWKKSRSGGDADIESRAKKLVDSAKVKLELLGMNDSLMQELEKAGEPDKSLLVGRPGGTVWMYAPIYEYDLDAVKPGQTVRVTAQTVAPGKFYEGEIRAIDPVIDPQTRSVNVRARLQNPEGVLKPNVFVNSEIHVDLGEKLVIPESAVLDSGERQIAFVAVGEGTFEPRDLKLGSKVDDGYVVLSGVSEGEKVVDQATFFVDSESKLKAALDQSGGSGAMAGHQH